MGLDSYGGSVAAAASQIWRGPEPVFSVGKLWPLALCALMLHLGHCSLTSWPDARFVLLIVVLNLFSLKTLPVTPLILLFRVVTWTSL